MKVRFVVFDQTWQLEERSSFEEEWTEETPHCGDEIMLSDPLEIATVKRRIWSTSGDLVLHVVRKERTEKE